ncbi:bactofilin family protein [Shumkonia mesophila]|uniref:bactofilin family protein n=1 Tax=Shumkonia mesophila TaxID=2838854 RepID=UPI00293445F0|nr:polymer-forming cytoskeletal protein [Shumkonia mesophila]
MFRKKQDENDGSMKPVHEGDRHDQAAPPLKPFSRKGSHMPIKSAAVPPARPEIPRRPVDQPPASPPRRFERQKPNDDNKKLTVGRDICLKGEITSCNKLIVEGQVEAELADARAIEVAPTGYFKGSANVEEADISGLYEGELLAREILTVRAGGRIHGTVRYGRVVIEAGGEISGDMRALAPGEADALRADDAAAAEEPAAEAAPVDDLRPWPRDDGETTPPAATGPDDPSGHTL